MPLYKDAASLIRANLQEISAGGRVKRVEIGDLSEEHVVQINKFRTDHGFLPITGKIVFIGKHIHRSRIDGDGYSIDEVLEQIESARNPSVRTRRWQGSG